MFTGIVEATGSLTMLAPKGGDYEVQITSDSLDFTDVSLGDSIATNGVCLTVISKSNNSFNADVSRETIKHTGFAHYKVGQKVNLEKAMLPTTRFGGHMVSGHVDAVATVTNMVANGRAQDIWLSLPDDLAKYVVTKGSITIDGISLTVNDVANSQFKLTIVPHTSAETTINNFVVGTKVNLEVDIIARYVEKLIGKSSEGVSMDLLTRTGFIK